MQRSTLWGIAGGGMLLVVGLLVWFVSALNAPKPTPEMLITQTLNDAKAAARKRDANGIMDALSDDFKAGEFTKNSLRLIVIRSLRQSRGTDYGVSILRPEISPVPGKPDTRIVVSKFDVFYSDNGESIWGTSPLTMVMREEKQRKWLFFSEPKWRIVSVPSLPPGIGGGDDTSIGLPSLSPISP